MRYSFLENKKLIYTDVEPNFSYEADVLVAGLGTAGSIAAISAARTGAKVLGIEREAVIGGAGTLGCIWDYYYGTPGGIGTELNEKCYSLSLEGFSQTSHGREKDSYSGSVRAYVTQKAVNEAGCKTMYNTYPLGVFHEGDKVCGIRCFRNGEIIDIKTKNIVDSTGDSFVIRLAGGQMIVGREIDNKLFSCSNPGVLLDNGKLCSRWLQSSIEDTTDEDNFSDIILRTGSYLPFTEKEYTETRRLADISGVLGERGAPQLVAEEVLTFSDYANGYRTDKPLFYAFSQVDDINFDVSNISETSQNWRFIAVLYFYGISIGIPLKALIPKGLDGIVAASKGIGIDYDLLGCLRMRRNIEKCGEAAGVVAALSAIKNISVKDVPYDEIINILKKDGCFNREHDVGICNLLKPDGKYGFHKAFIPKTVDEYKNMLSQAKPELALWTASLTNDADIFEHIRFWTDSDDETLKVNSIIALAMRNDTSVCDALFSILEKKPKEMTEITREPFCYHPYVAALCLSGRIGNDDNIGKLIGIIENAKEIADNFLYQPDKYFTCREDWEFILISLALASVIKIVKRTGNKDYDAYLSEWLDENKCPVMDIFRYLVYKSSIKNLVKNYFDSERCVL